MAAARILMCAAGALILSGCLGPLRNGTADAERGRAGLAAFFAPAGPGDTRAAPLTRVALAGGDVVVAAPEGYCIDPRSRQSGPDRGFAVIASCYILSGGQAKSPVEPMLVTVTVGPRGDTADLPTPEALAAAAGAELVTAEVTEDRVLAQLASGGEQMFDGSDRRYWRGAFLQGDRLVGLALYAPKGSPLAGARGAAMLGRVKESIAGGGPAQD